MGISDSLKNTNTKKYKADRRRRKVKPSDNKPSKIFNSISKHYVRRNEEPFVIPTGVTIRGRGGVVVSQDAMVKNIMVKEKVDTELVLALEEAGDIKLMYGHEWVFNRENKIYLSKFLQARERSDGIVGAFYSYYADNEQTIFNITIDSIDHEHNIYNFKVLSVKNKSFFMKNKESIEKFLTYDINYNFNNDRIKNVTTKLNIN